ncbi:MAG: SAM-dependent methyltransferase, partial [Acidobacteria bacterium]
ATPWRLDAGRPALLERWLEERVEAAAEQEPGQAATLLAWHERRRDQLRAGLLAVRVHHEDLLVLPR